MKVTINFNEFWERQQRMTDYKNKYTMRGAEILFEHLESIEEETGEEMECDIIAIACEYGELTPEEYITNYRLDKSDLDDDEYIIDRYTFDCQDYVLYQCH